MEMHVNLEEVCKHTGDKKAGQKVADLGKVACCKTLKKPFSAAEDQHFTKVSCHCARAISIRPLRCAKTGTRSLINLKPHTFPLEVLCC